MSGTALKSKGCFWCFNLICMLCTVLYADRSTWSFVFVARDYDNCYSQRGVRSIVSMSVCLSTLISQKPHVQISPYFLCVLPMAVLAALGTWDALDFRFCGWRHVRWREIRNVSMAYALLARASLFRQFTDTNVGLYGTVSLKWKTRRKISADIRIFFSRCSWTATNASVPTKFCWRINQVP